MAKLEVMLEQRGIVTSREMSEAIARCQLHGGDLTTSLLQFVSADEAQLSAALSECYALPGATVGLLPAPDDAALRSLPREVAERYCCFPVEAGPGRLVLAVAHPLDPALKEELSNTLGVSIEERVALEVRIRQALARFYGLPMSARNQRGISRLEGDVEGAGHETPLGLWSDAQLSSLPRPPSDLPSILRDSQRPPSARPRSRAETPARGVPSTPPAGSTRPNRRRGPMSLAQAREELGRAGSRNDVLEIFFGFASQFFEYSALFAVHNALAEGLDAWGKGADRERVLGIGVPLDLPSSLSESAESCKVRLTRLGKEGIDRTLMGDLQRQFNSKALILPVSLRGRCAVLLYADNGEADVLEREIADVVALSPDVANALGRIILQRKKDAARHRGSDAGELLASLPPLSSEPAGARVSSEVRRDARGPVSAPASVGAARGSESVLKQPVVSIGPDTTHTTRSRPSSPPAAPASANASVQGFATLSSAAGSPAAGDDPVFLLARPQAKAKARHDAAREREPVSSVQKPPISITRPAPLVASRPRLPSVMVDPEFTDSEASVRATRAAAITRAPTQARSSMGRRPIVPPLAEAPRGATEAESRRLATTSPPAAMTSRASGEGVGVASGATGMTTAEAAVSSSSHGAGDSRERFGTNEGYRPPAAPGVAELASIGDELLDDGLGERSNDVWPPPIMDNSPPPRQPALTALVPIIIADSPKNRRGYITRGARGAQAKGGVQQRGLSSRPPASSAGPASPTVPSPARARQLDAGRGAEGLEARTVIVGASGVQAARASEELAVAQRASSAMVTERAPSNDARAVIVSEATSGRDGAGDVPATSSSEAGGGVFASDSRASSPLSAVPRVEAQSDASGGWADELLAANAEADATAARLASSAAAHVSNGALPSSAPSADSASESAASESAVSESAVSPHIVAASQTTASNAALAEAPVAAEPATTEPATAGAPVRRSQPPPRSIAARDDEGEEDANGSTEPTTEAASGTPARPRSTPPLAPSRLAAAATVPRALSTRSPTAPGTRESRPPVGGRAAAAAHPAVATATASGWVRPVAIEADDVIAHDVDETDEADETTDADWSLSDASAASESEAVAPAVDASDPATAGAAARGATSNAATANAATASSATAIGATSNAATASSAEGSSSVGEAAATKPSVPRVTGVVRPTSAGDAKRPLPGTAPAPFAPRPAGAQPVAAIQSTQRSVSTSAVVSLQSLPMGKTLGNAPSPADRLTQPATPRNAGSGASATRAAASPAEPGSVSAAASTSASGAIPTSPSPKVSDASTRSAEMPGPAEPKAAGSAAAAPVDPAAAGGDVPSAGAAAPATSSTDPTVDAAATATRSASAASVPSAITVAVATGSDAVMTVPVGPRRAEAVASAKGLGGFTELRPAIFPPPPPADAEIEEMVDRACQGNLKAVQDLARIGAPSLPQVMARFPGPVISERAGPTSRASECGPLLQALAAMGGSAMASITRSSEDRDARVRRWATLLLGEIPGPEACRAVVQRLADDEPRVHQAALDAARLLLASPAADLFRKTLFEVAEAEDAPLTLRLRTLEHVAKLKDSVSVPRLIAFLAADVEPIVHKALWALTVVTRHDFGRDAKAWSDFWHSNRHLHRIEWLIEALDERDPRLRKAASDELREETGELFGYAENMPRGERLEAQRKFREWWQSTGVTRHIRVPRADAH